jgi:Mn-dependent DtxR family transcriptional regulator
VAFNLSRAKTLGVQRSSVTLVARKFQEAGLINYRRGRIHILDIEALQASSCECYAVINRHFQRLVGWESHPDNQAGAQSG